MLKPLAQSEEVEQEENKSNASKLSDKASVKTEELFFPSNQATARNVRRPPTTSSKHLEKFLTTAWSQTAFPTGSRSAEIPGLGLLTVRQSATKPTSGCHLRREPRFPPAAPAPTKKWVEQLAQPPKVGLPGRYPSL